MIAAVVVVAALAATPVKLDEVREASRRATSAQLAELERQRNAEQVRQARAPLLPQLGVGVGANYTIRGPQLRPTGIDPSGNPTYDGATERTPTGSQAGYGLQANLNQSVFNATQWAQLSAANARFDASAHQAREDTLSAELEGMRRFFELVRAQKSLEVLTALRKNSEEFAERAEALFQAGRRRKEDAISARVNLANDRINELRAAATVTRASSDLAAWIHRPVTDELRAEDPDALKPVDAPLPAFDRALEAAKQNRPQLQALEALSRAAEEAVAGARGAYLPTVGVGLTYRRNAPEVGIFVDPTVQNSLVAGVDVRWDVFSGFQTNAQVSEARIAHQRAVAQQRQAEQDVAADLMTRLHALRVQKDVVALAATNVQLAQDNLRLAQIRFEEGAGSTLEIRDAQVKRTQAELSDVESQIDLQFARASLERAIGAFGPGVAQ